VDAASFLTAFTGNNKTTNNLTKPQDATINFGVLSGDWRTDPAFKPLIDNFTGGAGFSSNLTSTPGQYLYLYQVVNNGKTPSTQIDRFTIQLPSVAVGTKISTVGYFSKTSDVFFKDVEGTVNASNDFGPNGKPFVTSPSVVPNIGVVNPGVTTGSGGRIPIIEVSVVGDVLSFQFSTNGANGQPIFDGQSSVLLGFVTDLPPNFDNSSVQDGSSANAFVPVPTPEPSTAILLGIAGLFAGSAGIRNRFKVKT